MKIIKIYHEKTLGKGEKNAYNTGEIREKILLKMSLNNGQKCRKLVFMRVSGICFLKWL